jgi:hypothetical protein
LSANGELKLIEAGFVKIPSAECKADTILTGYKVQLFDPSAEADDLVRCAVLLAGLVAEVDHCYAVAERVVKEKMEF